MPDGTHEHTINDALGEVLRELGQKWSVKTERTGKIFEEGGRPDILIEKSDGWPVVLEAEVENRAQAQKEAVSRLGNRLAENGDLVHAAIAVVYPKEFRLHAGKILRKTIEAEKIEYVLLTQSADSKFIRFPEHGWLSGKVSDLAVLIHRSSIPAWKVSELAEVLESGVKQAEGSFRSSHKHGSKHGKEISAAVGQEDDSEGQARRMAMAIVADAMIFHAALHEAELWIPDVKRHVKSPNELRSEDGGFIQSQVMDEWGLILDVNYHPIFHTAREILRALSTKTAWNVLRLLWEAAEKLTASNVNKSHDLTGIVFQRLIADRQFLATYYTKPAAAALLAGLALPAEAHIAGKKWSDSKALRNVRIGDFACGTGTLLSTSYQRFSLLHEINGGDPEKLHAFMMEKGIIGLDVLAVAVHLTAAMLASAYPSVTFDGECLLTMPYGVKNRIASVGSLELLQGDQMPLAIVQSAAKAAGGRGEKEIEDLVSRMSYDEFDLVIMNPPFTRATSREGGHKNVPNPAFAAFNTTKEEQKKLASHARSIAGKSSCGDGNAGMATYFVDLGHRKTAPSGMLALVLPLSALSGDAWEKVRSLWRANYMNPVVVTIAGSGTHSSSFSADTGMAECLFVGRKKTEQEIPEGRAHFAVLKSQPSDTIQGEQIALAISKLSAEGGLRRLEGGPFGGTPIMIGDSDYGKMADAPLPEEGAWQIAGLNDITIGQTAHQLGGGRLWIEGMPAGKNVPICKIGDIGKRGLVHRDVYEGPAKPGALPRGPFERFEGCSEGDAYPALYGHDNKRERRLVVEPDSHCGIRQVDGDVPQTLIEKAGARWRTAVKPHYNLELRFNSQSLIVAMTPKPSLGGSGWATFAFEDERHEFPFALWCNSTLGFVCHWWMSNKSQSGRGRCSVKTFPRFMTLDVRQLTDAQLAAAERVFNDLSSERFLPFDQIDEDSARSELDSRLLKDVLGLSLQLNADMKRLRQKLAREPQIYSDKKTRVVFTEGGEKDEKRADRAGEKTP